MNNEPLEMNEQALLAHEEQAILIIASRLLNYPPDTKDELLDDIQVSVDEDVETDFIKKELQNIVKFFSFITLKDLQELYVKTFDMQAKLGLYLTAHEFGDSPKRGAALIKLQKNINQAGFERIDDELADYIPMLLELLAVAPDSAQNIRLYKRMAVAMHRMVNNIDEGNPYELVLRLLITHVFPKPTDEEVANLENNREEADLEELPFPIMYQ